MLRSNTAFSGAVQNSANDHTLPHSIIFQNASGQPEDLFCGALLNLGDNTPSIGYDGIEIGGGNTTSVKNGGQWYAKLASDGSKVNGTYATISADYRFASIGDEIFPATVNTLGNPTPKGRAGTALQIVIGKQNYFGERNFTAIPTETQKYATISDGLLVPGTSAGSNGTLYFEILQQDYYTEATGSPFKRYRVIANDGTVR